MRKDRTITLKTANPSRLKKKETKPSSFGHVFLFTLEDFQTKFDYEIN